MLLVATTWPYFVACCKLMNIYSRVLSAVETTAPSGRGRAVFTWDVPVSRLRALETF